MKSVVTRAGLELLKGKLDEKIEQLKKLREEKAHAYSASGDGWHDNPGWIQLGQQEEMLANEVTLLQQRISNARIIDSIQINDGRVQIGCIVDYMIIKRPGERALLNTVEIVGSGESDVKNKRISYDSPIGKALANMENGDEKVVELPAGKVTIIIKSIRYE